MLERPRFQENSLETFSGWFLLALIAGCVNAGGFLALNRFVTHVTGFATLFGVDVVTQNWREGLSMLSVPGFFFIGAFLAGYFVDYQIRYGKQPNYTFVLLLEFFCLLAAAVGGIEGYFGSFGHELIVERDYILLALLCFSMGIQNGVVTSSSSGIVRTTHLTGLTTDLGLGAIRWFYMFKDGERGTREYKKEIWANGFRFGTIISFCIGSALGGFMFLYYGYGGFFMPALLVLLALSLVRNRKLKARLAEKNKIEKKLD